jgi:hypothetical protein
METSAESMQKNRRRSQRRPARKTVKLQCRAGAHGLGPNLCAEVLDISDTGVRLIITRPLHLAEEVEIFIDGYGMKASIKRLGNIRWQVELKTGLFGVGIQFQKNLDYRDWQNLTSPN